MNLFLNRWRRPGIVAGSPMLFSLLILSLSIASDLIPFQTHPQATSHNFKSQEIRSTMFGMNMMAHFGRSSPRK